MKNLTLLTISLLLLGGCSDERSLPDLPGKESKYPLVIQSVLISPENATRAAGYEELEEGESIGIFMEGATGSSGYVEAKNIKYTHTAEGYAPDKPDETIYLGAQDANICAYYKPTLDVTDKTKVALTNAHYTEERDLVYAKNVQANGTSAKSQITFNMEHAYSQIEFSFERKNYPNTCNITDVTLKNSALIKKATLNIATAAYTTIETATELTFKANEVDPATGVTVPSTGDCDKVNLLVVPCTLADTDRTNGLTVTFKVDDKDMSMKIPFAKLNALKAGTRHKITASLNGTGIEVVSVQIAKWSDSDEGTFEPEP